MKVSGRGGSWVGVTLVSLQPELQSLDDAWNNRAWSVPLHPGFPRAPNESSEAAMANLCWVAVTRLVAATYRDEMRFYKANLDLTGLPNSTVHCRPWTLSLGYHNAMLLYLRILRKYQLL